MTMTKSSSNGGGRIAYASRAAAQLLGLGGVPSPSPKKAKYSRSPKMNHPIQLKFSSNKQPLFPRRRASTDSYADKYAQIRPHSSNNVNTNHVPHPPHPVSVPVTPSLSGGGAGYPSTFSNNNINNQTTNTLYRSPPHRNQLRMSQHVSSYNNLSRTHHQPLVHPRSAHGVTSPIKALPNTNILHNMANTTTHRMMAAPPQSMHHRPEHPVSQPNIHAPPAERRQPTAPHQPMNPLNATYSGPKLRRHLSASAASSHSAHHNHRGGGHVQQQRAAVVRPHSYSPTKSSGLSVEDLNLPPLAPVDDDGPSSSPSPSNIRVVIRVRPLSENEQRARRGLSIKMLPTDGAANSANSMVVEQLNKRDGSVRKEKQFTFDRICHGGTSQAQFFEDCGVRQLVDKALDGYAATMFAYGQTGSGKTYSVCGENESLYDDDGGPGVQQLSGIIPRTILDLWTKMSALSESAQSRKQYTVRAGYLEIYNERPRDLLNPHFRNLSVRWNSESGFFVENQCIVRCESAQDLLAVFNEGELNRQTGAHEINSLSSRSHCLFTMHVEATQQCGDDEDRYVQNGKISIVDLAGSEKLKDSKQMTDKGLRETANINRSLFTLGKVISTLEKVQSKELAASTYIPYRDSVLTKLLMDSLGGSGMAIMIACVSPSRMYTEETLSTLYYASRARNIQNVPTKKIGAKDRIIAQLLQEVQRLKTQNLRMKHYILKCNANPNNNNSNALNALNAPPPPNCGLPLPPPTQPMPQPLQPPQMMQSAAPQQQQQSVSRQQRPQYLSQSQAAPRSPLPPQQQHMSPQGERPLFSWEATDQNEQNKNRVHPQSTSARSQTLRNSVSSRVVLHPLSTQQQPPAPLQQQPQLRTKPPLMYGHSAPMYQQSPQHQQQARMQQNYEHQIESLQAAKLCAEEDACSARQQNTKLMDKIEHLETVFMH